MQLLGFPAGDTLRDAALSFLIVVIAALIGLAVVFGFYALILRLRHERRLRRREKLEELWREPVLLALESPETAESVHELVEDRYRLHFVRFCLGYARRVRGEERRTLQALALPYLAPLTERLLSPEVGIRTRAVQTLGTLGLPTYAAALLRALDDPSPLVAMVAARGLARDEHPEYAWHIIRRMGRFEGWSRAFLASLLASIGPECAPDLRKGFGDREEIPWVRAVTGDALGILKDLAAADIAAEVVEIEEDPELLASALRLLTVVGRPEHTDVIRARCASPDATVRSFALSALGTVGEETDVPRLLGAMADPSPWVAIHAARGLLAAGGVQLLQDLADSDHPRAVLAGQILLEEAGS